LHKTSIQEPDGSEKIAETHEEEHGKDLEKGLNQGVHPVVTRCRWFPNEYSARGAEDNPALPFTLKDIPAVAVPARETATFQNVYVEGERIQHVFRIAGNLEARFLPEA
jgi:hypothetical protein